MEINFRRIMLVCSIRARVRISQIRERARILLPISQL